jgi:hypothetical protein
MGYLTDLTDEQWAWVEPGDVAVVTRAKPVKRIPEPEPEPEPVAPPKRRGGRPKKTAA